MRQVTIDWSTANVPTPGPNEGFKLVVKLSPEPAYTPWFDAFTDEARRLREDLGSPVVVGIEGNTLTVSNVDENDIAGERQRLDGLMDRVHAKAEELTRQAEREHGAAERLHDERVAKATELAERFRAG